MSPLSSGARICAGAALRYGAPDIQSLLAGAGGARPAFAARYRGRVYADRTVCAQNGNPFDWNEGEFFDADDRYLICATHGARYDHASGARGRTPAPGRRLIRLAVEE